MMALHLNAIQTKAPVMAMAKIAKGFFTTVGRLMVDGRFGKTRHAEWMREKLSMPTLKRLLGAPVFFLGLMAFHAILVAEQEAPIGSVRDVYNGSLRTDVEVSTFRHIDQLFPSRVVPHGKFVYPLPKSSRELKDISFTSRGRVYRLDDYLALNRVTGLLVIKDGQIALENYRFGNSEQTRWVSWSLVKSITSTLLGAAIKDGYIRGLDDPVTRYLPQLSRSAYQGVSIRNLVQMASGVGWNEAYTDPSSDRRHMLELQIQQRPGAILSFMGTLPRVAPPGTRWNYSTGETHVLGALVRAAVKRPLSEYLSEKIWAKFGMEADATWWLESPGGLEVGGSGLSARLRDYGRFGVFVLGGGKAGGEQVVPAGWFPDAGRPKRVGNSLVDYGYMWWSFGSDSEPVHQGAFEGIGIFGQFIYINPRHNVVIVVWSARPKPTGSTVVADEDFFAATATALER
jgi:CubicO group peptidase (beta-lactamase class C family)